MPQPIDQTLAEQLNVTPHEIEYRKHLFDFTAKDVRRLVSCRALMERQAETIVRDFYAEQKHNDEIAAIIGDADTLARLHRTQRLYLIELCCGQYDQDYVNRRLYIGKVHRRAGVSPKLYMTSVRRLQRLIDEALDADGGARDMSREKDAFHKILFFDAQFVFDAYIDSFMQDVDSVRTEIEEHAHILELGAFPCARELREFSSRDKLTGLYNHRAFYDFLERELAVAERHRLPICLVYFDLNDFKKVNDTSGHDEGNRVLEGVGEAVRQSVRTIDIPCRYGGDEFCVILPRTEIEAARHVCDRIIDRFRDTVAAETTFSMGLAQAGPDRFVEPERFIRLADQLMYDAKKMSRQSPGFHVSARDLSTLQPCAPAAA